MGDATNYVHYQLITFSTNCWTIKCQKKVKNNHHNLLKPKVRYSNSWLLQLIIRQRKPDALM